MLADYGFLGLFLIISVIFTLILLLTPIILRFIGLAPKNKPNPTKNSTYECGMVPVGKACVQFNFRFYFFAVLFVAFDVLTVFLYPWAVNINSAAGKGLAAVAILLSIIFVAFVYAWKKGALQWK